MPESEAIAITVNGESFSTRDQIPLPEFLESRNLRPDRVVVEWNGEPKTRQEASEIRLSAGDVLEVVRIVAGG